MKHLITSMLLSAAVSTTAFGGETDFAGYVAGEGRFFLNDPALPGQDDASQLSAVIEPELRWYSDDDSHTLTFILFARLDSVDDERSHVDIREANWSWASTSWEVLAGADRVFWGVTESRHLVDIINQTDALENIDEEDKLGQPMLRVGTYQDFGEFQFYYMPYFREREYPGAEGRLRGPLPVGDAQYESSAEEWHQDVALRYSHFLGNWDVGAHVFYGTSREASLQLSEDGESLIPFYSIISQGGLDIQYTREAWLWKFEGIVREGQGDTFGAAVGGVEYTLYQLFGSAADLGLLAELHHDDRDEEAPTTLFDDDTFAGLRLAANDAQDSQLLVGAVVDNNNSSTFIFAEAERRFGDSWFVELEARLFANIDDEDPSSLFKEDDFINLSIQRHF